MSKSVNPISPSVFIPLEYADKCSACDKTGVKLKVCVACGEALYCSTDCQRQNWKVHKSSCGRTDRVDFETYYPFLAAIQNACRKSIHKDGFQHAALRHEILNSPNPGSGEDILNLPDGSGDSAQLVFLGNKIDKEDLETFRWWPTAFSPDVRAKLVRRIMAEGLLLPIVFATTLALIGQMYSAEVGDGSLEDGRRVRLHCKKSPIVDIGIAKGVPFNVTNGDRLFYYNSSIDEFIMGQDPKDHYWMYIKTLDGHEYFLDCGMYTFNLAIVVDVSKYLQSTAGPDRGDWVPAYFYSREMEKAIPLSTGRFGYRPKERFSILRNLELRRAMQNNEGPQLYPVLLDWMDKIAGRTCDTSEKQRFSEFFKQSSSIFHVHQRNRQYLNFPKETNDVKLMLDLDPHEAPNSRAEYTEEAEINQRYLKKLTSKLKKGQISGKQWNHAFDRWMSRPHKS
ncbi:hypothetical protein CPB83DRAFT_267583 [Crepidotus variabilis]|uniref:MYND-type domain-containing protein n=1 Tax=Crepidotus variabilis TaxID=179855 RepID=A0A9P6JR83_9AGAR|nr:hypothetical protein CPB83DRAFT_267583 [Crepidotus variabilis]